MLVCEGPLKVVWLACRTLFHAFSYRLMYTFEGSLVLTKSIGMVSVGFRPGLATDLSHFDEFKFDQINCGMF